MDDFFSIASGASLYAGLFRPPMLKGEDRASSSRLFQSVAQAVRPSTLGGSGFSAGTQWGPTYTYVDRWVGWAWTNPGGDWIDASGVTQGGTPFASFTTNAVSGSATPYVYTNIDVTALLQYTQTRNKPAAFTLRRSAGAATRNISGMYGSYAVPSIAVTYADGSSTTLNCLVIAASNNTQSNNISGDVLASTSFWEFVPPTKAVAAAVLSHVAVTQHWSGTATLGFFVCNPPKNTQPVTGNGGLASSAGNLDDGLHAVSGMLGVQRYVDGTTLTDFGTSNIFDKYKEPSYSPELWGGAVDLTKLPHALLGSAPNIATAKFLGLITPLNTDVTLVPSGYTTDGFAPLAPGLGALRINIQDDGIPTGGISGYAGTTGADATLYLPAEKSGLVDRIFVRAYYRLATPKYPTPSDRREYFREGNVNPDWAALGGKWGCTPYHVYGRNGAYPNSGGSGGGYGYQLRYGWALCDEGNGGPDCGGLMSGWHLYDFQRNPPPYSYYGDTGQLTQWGKDGGRGGVMYVDRWYCVETEVHLNTVNVDGSFSPDGILRTWIDGVQVYERTDLVFRTLPRADWTPDSVSLRPHRNLGVQALWLNHFHGGVNSSSVRTTWFMTGLAYGEQRIGPMKGIAA